MSSPSIVLARNFGAIASPADTEENLIASVTIPAKSLGYKGVVRIKTIWTTTSSGNNKTLAVKFGATAVVSNIVTTVAGVVQEVEVGVTGATNAQIASSNTFTPAAIINAETTAAIDTTADVVVGIYATKASGGETATLKGYIVEILP
jgi:VCBS repeat-containing protein